MANLTIYLPDELAARVRAAKPPTSRICQAALAVWLEHHTDQPAACQNAPVKPRSKGHRHAKQTQH